MSKLEQLVTRYETFCDIPWEQSLAGPQRVWFVVYDSTDERRLRARLTEFEVATKKAGHGWRAVDLTDAFGRWIAAQEYRESFFECPEDIEPLLPQFEQELAARVSDELVAGDENSVVAIYGVGSLFGSASVSGLCHKVASSIKGRLVVFFPGAHHGNNYRLLDAKVGWNYLAVAITAHDGGDGQ